MDPAECSFCRIGAQYIHFFSQQILLPDLSRSIELENALEEGCDMPGKS
jgi:hypothetical protein